MTDETRNNIRGGTLLLVGRGLSLVINMSVQLLTVRYLTRLDYGLFAMSFTTADLAALAIVFGMDTALARYVPIYQANGEYRRVFGATLLAVIATLSLSLIVLLPAILFREQFARLAQLDAEAYQVLMILIVLGPLNAVNRLVSSLTATFAGAWPIFFRRHLLGPGLKLLVITGVMVTNSSVLVLAIGHVAACAIALVTYIIWLLLILRKQGLLHHATHPEIPAREILGFALPQLASDVAYLPRAFLLIILLHFHKGTASIAEYWSVHPIALLNDVVIAAFSPLFMPAFARVFASGQFTEANRAYWRTATWITVLTFPVFALTTVCADPLTELLFGSRYASSGQILAFLSFGYFFHAAMGLNYKTLRVLGYVRLGVLLELVTTALAVVLYGVLVPRYGATGAGVATSLTLIGYGLIKQAALLMVGDIVTFNRRHAVLVGTIVVLTGGIMLLDPWWTPSLLVGGLIAAVGWAVLLYVNRDILQVQQTFPELSRLPVVRHLFRTANPAH